jgi:Flp pilus assembly protein TadG
MKFIYRKRLKNEKGQAMVEFALILPLLLMLVFGIFEVSWFMYGKLSLENAAREGARAGSVGTTITEATTSAESRIQAIIPDNVADNLTVSISYTSPSDFRNGDIIVDVGTDMEPLTPIAGIFGFDTIHLESECQMKMN